MSANPANKAPRNDDTVKDGANGEPYRMAVTESGLVVFASHYEALSDLAHGGRITAVYVNPGSNSVYKPHEQFRSAGVAEMVNYPQELVPLYQYGSALERNRAIARGDHNEPIPVVEDGFAYVDRFGNGIVRTSDMEPLIALDVGKMATLLVASQGTEHRVKVRRGIDLRSANVGEITVYPNLSDGYSSGAGIFEVMVRVNGDPSHSRETAVYALMKQVPGLDVRTASARLVV